MKIDVLASGSTGNCYRVSDGVNSLLLECGIPFSWIQRGCHYFTSSISGCLVTHRHGDHARCAAEVIRRGIPVYGPEDVAKQYPGTRVLEPLKRYEINSFEVIPISVSHDVPCYAYVLYSEATRETLAYITDTPYLPNTIPGINYLMVEANHSRKLLRDHAAQGLVQRHLAERIVKTHMSIESVIELIKSNDMTQCKQIHLLHLSTANSDAAAFKDKVEKLTGAEVYVY